MTIVIDATAAVSGGKVYLQHLLPQLAGGGDCRYIVFHNGDLDGLDLPSIELRRVTSTGARSWVLGSLRKLAWRLLVFPLHLRRLGADLVFSNAGFLPVGIPAGARTVVAIHNSMPLREELIAGERSVLRRWRLRILSRLMRNSLKRCDAAIVFSEDSRRRVVAEVGPLKRNPAVVHHGIDWGEAQRRQAVDIDRLERLGIVSPYLLFVSQFHRYKNIEKLVGAFALLSARHPELLLVLVGETPDQAYWREVRAVIDRHRLGDRVIHIPQCPREELIEIYNGARVFVHPSLAETCSFPLLEAMALGLPIAAARAAALPEIAADGAAYFDPDNEAEMAAVIDRLIVDEQLREDLGERASRRASGFTWEETGRLTLEVIESVAAEKIARIM